MIKSRRCVESYHVLQLVFSLSLYIVALPAFFLFLQQCRKITVITSVLNYIYNY